MIEGYQGMKARRASMPDFHLPRLGESVLRIIEFYTELKRSDKVAEWKAEFARLDSETKQSLMIKPLIPGTAHAGTSL